MRRATAKRRPVTMLKMLRSGSWDVQVLVMDLVRTLESLSYLKGSSLPTRAALEHSKAYVVRKKVRHLEAEAESIKL